MKVTTGGRILYLVIGLFLGLALGTASGAGRALAAALAIAPTLPDCPTDAAENGVHNGIIYRAVSPREISRRGGFHGTITVHPGIAHTCVVPLPGGAVLRADGPTAPPPHGRAVFRIIGRGLDTAGGVSIIASASLTDNVSVPETLPALNADAVVSLPPGTVLMRYDPARDRFLPVPDGHIRQAGDTVYRIVRRGASPVPSPAAASMPTTLPATGGSPLRTWSTTALLVLFGSLLARRLPGPRRAGPRRVVGRKRLRWAWAAGGPVLLTGAALVYLYGMQSSTPGFGALDATGPVPHAAGAAGPPVRLTIARLGIDTPVILLGVAGGAWQVPAYSAGYLAGTAWPGQRGNEAIAGHDDRDGAVFRRLSELRAGDVVQVYAGGHVYRYGVVALRVVPATRVDVLRPTRGATLTLITCTPYLVDTERLVARAQLLS